MVREIAKISPKFRFRVLRNFAKFKENFTKHEINNFMKISRNYENENFRSHPTPGIYVRREMNRKRCREKETEKLVKEGFGLVEFLL